jgi:outer membrane receptor for ferrienterochelin and colicins
MTFNQSFFYTYISHPVINSTNPDGYIESSNALWPVTTSGSETYLRMKFFKKLEVYLGYVFTDARKEYDSVNTMMSLSARNKVSSVITYEPGSHWMIGVESSYIDWQYTDDHVRHPDYFFLAMMVSYKVKNWRFVLNGENLLDFRQSRVEDIVLPPYTNPIFPQLWAPIDGRVINLSVTFSFYSK